MKRVLITTTLCAGVVCGAYGLEQLQYVGEAHAQPIPMDAGSGSAETPAPLPHTTIDDPTTNPSGFIQDVKDAAKKGWAGLVLVVLYGLTRVVGYLGRRVPALAKLNSGWIAMLIAAAGTLIEAGVDALFLGGSMVSVLVAMLWAGVGLISPAAKKPATT